MQILLLIIILSGIRFNYFDWKNNINRFLEFSRQIKRGFHPNDFFIPDCECGECKPLTDDEKIKRAKEMWFENINDQRDTVISNTAYSIFNTSIVVVALIQYITLIKN